MPKKHKFHDKGTKRPRRDEGFSDDEESNELEGVPQASKQNVEVLLLLEFLNKYLTF